MDYYDDSTSGAPNATTDEHGYDLNRGPIPKGSNTRATGLLNAHTVSVVDTTNLACPTPPMSSMVNTLHGNGTGILQIFVPHGHKYTTMLVHTDGCGINESNESIIGSLCTCTRAFVTVTGDIGINGYGGHQHVRFFTLIDLGIGGDEQG